LVGFEDVTGEGLPLDGMIPALDSAANVTFECLGPQLFMTYSRSFVVQALLQL